MNSVIPFLRRNRYTASLCLIAAVVLVSSCSDCFVATLAEDCGLSPSSCDSNGLLSSAAVQGESPIHFERNVGQTGPEYDFVSYPGETRLLLASQEAVLQARRGKGSSLRARVLGGRAVKGEALEPVAERTNYLIGNDRSKWLTNVPNFQRVRFPQVYPGVDLVYYGHGQQLEHDFVVAPGADPAQIRLQFEGASEPRMNSEGGLDLDLDGSRMTWRKPVVYQAIRGHRRKVEARYAVASGGRVSFEVGEYDRTKPLTIDPVVAYSTFYGRGDSESAARVALDASGNVYFTGGSGDTTFPVSSGAVHGVGSSGYLGDAIVVKLSADGKTGLYTTHIGGMNTDIGLGIAVDQAGAIYIAGLTNSSDFPVTAGAFQTKTPRVSDKTGNCFVAKLNNAGTDLIYSSFLGGSTGDLCTGIGVDSAGNAYVTGATASKNFPTANAQQAALAGTAFANMDAFVSKISPDGSKLLYSTFLGGSKADGALAIAVDAAGNSYITGGTMSSDFPVTPGAAQGAFAGTGGQRISLFASGDAFVAKLDANGRLVYSTYLGGSQDDLGIGIAIDSQGAAYIAGSTMSGNFPLRGAFQSAYKGAGGEVNLAAGDGFVAKLNPQGSALVYSSLIGGSRDDRASAIAVDKAGNAYITGNTISADFPVTADAQQPRFGGERPETFRTGDAFFAQIGPAGALVSSTYLGGAGNDWGAGIAVDAQGSVVVTGGTDSSDFPTTPNSVQPRFGGAAAEVLPAGDAWVMKFGVVPSVSIAAVVNAASYAAGAVSPGEIVTIVGNGMGPDALQPYSIQNGVFGTQVAGGRIFFDGVPAPIIYLSGKQSAVVVPYAVAGKAQTLVTVQYNGVTSAAFTVPVAATLPGLFSADSSGSGQGAILNQDMSYNSAANPAARGSIVVLYGTGEGQTTPGGIDGLIASSSFPQFSAPVSVSIGGTAVDQGGLAYAGEAPNLIAGVFQINVKIPCSAPVGNVPVTVQIGSGRSQAGVTVAVRNPTDAEGYCPVP